MPILLAVHGLRVTEADVLGHSLQTRALTPKQRILWHFNST
jgi:hypothetical protein